MSRPQKYTDSDITSAIEFLSSTGQDINPMRVRMKLGGGNVARIKAILEKRQPSQVAQARPPFSRPPNALLNEFNQLSQEASKQIFGLMNEGWEHACKEAALALHDDYSRLSRRVENLEGDLAASTGLLAEMEVQRDRALRDLEIRTKDREDLAKQCADLKAALRNAESDLRATQKIIGNFERNQQQDRDEIRQLQRRIEDFIAEIASLKSNLSRAFTSDKKTDSEKRNRNS